MWSRGRSSSLKTFSSTGGLTSDFEIYKRTFPYVVQATRFWPIRQMELQSRFRVLSKRAFSEVGKFSLKGTGLVRIQQYLRGRDRLVQSLFSGIHLTSGMPARGEELRRIRWGNTAAAPRNIFVYDGKIILIFSYNKACTNHSNSFYVVRNPCPAIERIMLLYLAYVRPFCEFLVHQIVNAPLTQTNRQLFTKRSSGSDCFTSQQCLRNLEESTRDPPMPFSVRTYRHIAIAMAKKHIPALIRPFDPHAPKDYDGFLRLLAFQTGHKPSTHAGSYALETAFPAKLQPDLIQRYLKNLDLLLPAFTGDQNSFLWPKGIGCWDPKRLTVILKRETNACLDAPMPISIYRHVAIAFSQRHLKGGGFKRDYDVEETARDNEATHDAWTAGRLYARGLEEAPGYVEARRAAFRRVSREWHAFLGFPNALGPRKRPLGENTDLINVKRPRPNTLDNGLWQ